MLKFSNTYLIFSDAATSPQAGIAIGAFIILTSDDLIAFSEYPYENLYARIAETIVVKQYESKRSTWAEITTVIAALHHINSNSKTLDKVEIYTDCQSLCDLLGARKQKLENNHFLTRSGKMHPNAELYKTLFVIAEKFQITTTKIKGHDSLRETMPEKIFSVLDKLSRKTLRQTLLMANTNHK
ncbi:MAG: hypothetical protein P4M14_00255 [Gammaproteobacteria bacterium]|nr:hypothetical protein [Gammaproteobacteria bacterium]